MTAGLESLKKETTTKGHPKGHHRNIEYVNSLITKSIAGVARLSDFESRNKVSPEGEKRLAEKEKKAEEKKAKEAPEEKAE